MEEASRLHDALRDRYRIERELGAGGMATVYLAEDVRHGRRVALKVLKPELATALGTERFLAEIRTTATLQHPHVVPLFDSGEAGGHLFYVMPLVEGESLRSRLRREGALPVEDAVRIVEQCAAALEYAHGKGVVHRDVKPANILLSGEHALVADFGIATAVHASGDAERLTGTGVSVGTVGYMSPEQLSAGGPIDGRSDLYALGCVLYEMLAGERLFHGSTPQAVIGRQLAGAEPVTRVRPAVPAAVDEVIRTACQPTAADRFRNPREMADALTAAVRSGRGGAPAVSRPAGRARRGIAAAAVVVVAVAAGWALLSAGRVTPPAKPVVAVLPFDDLDPSGEQAAFITGMHLDVIAELAAVSALDVLPSQAVQPYRGTFALDSVARELGADYLITASVQRAVDQVMLRLQLVEGDGRTVAATETYTRRLTAENVFDIQSEVARDAAAAMAVSMSPEEERRIAAVPTASLEAYDLYNAGRQLYEAHTDDDDLEVALDRYRAAVRLDSLFAPAWSGIADVFSQRTCCQAYPVRWADTALAYAGRALALDPTLVRAHQSMAKAHGPFERRDSTIQWYESALALNPNDAQSLNNLAVEHRLAGSFDRALEAAVRGAEILRTHRNIPANAAEAYAALGFEERASAWWERAMALGRLRPAPQEELWSDPEAALTSSWARGGGGRLDDAGGSILGTLDYLAGRFDAANDLLAAWLEAAPEAEVRLAPRHMVTMLGLSLWLAGDTAAARPHFDATVERVTERVAQGGTHWQYAFDLAAIRAVEGDVDEAFRWLDQAYAWGFRSRAMADGDPALAGLRSDPRFQAWRGRIEADIEAQRARVLEWERSSGIR